MERRPGTNSPDFSISGAFRSGRSGNEAEEKPQPSPSQTLPRTPPSESPPSQVPALPPGAPDPARPSPRGPGSKSSPQFLLRRTRSRRHRSPALSPACPHSSRGCFRIGSSGLRARGCGSGWIRVESGWRTGARPEFPRPTSRAVLPRERGAAHPAGTGDLETAVHDSLAPPTTRPLLVPPTPPRHPPPATRSRSTFPRLLPPRPRAPSLGTLPRSPSALPPQPPRPPPLPLPSPSPPLPSPVLSSHFQHLLRARSLRTITCPPKPAVLPPGTPLLKPPAPASPSPVRRGSPPAPSVPPPLQAPFPGFGSPHVYPSPPREVSGLSVCQSFGPSAPELQAASAIVSRAGGAGGPGAWVPAARAERPASQVRAGEAPLQAAPPASPSAPRLGHGRLRAGKDTGAWSCGADGPGLAVRDLPGFSVGQPEMAPQSEPREGSHNAQEQMSSSREERALGVCSGSASSTKF
ncbi:uncharacterized protein LOC129041661 [Pongo pygmaeus]|uniref:uncharacterized protein LOC129041661 n=1 Tax=Pongo pygmaeus TaxID=9600 RepID=UPI0023E1C03D|nr:uncharacterized protein LOC129041661 [Pongo pygmaeus]